jgi:hypothetical protein
MAISDQTTNFSNMVVDGQFSVNTLAPTSLAVGGGTSIIRIQKGTISVVTLTCTANGSTATQATVSPLATSDILLVSPQSSLSSGVVVHAYVSAGSTVQVVFSNMSTASNVIGGPCVLNYVAIRS